MFSQLRPRLWKAHRTSGAVTKALVLELETLLNGVSPRGMTASTWQDGGSRQREASRFNLREPSLFPLQHRRSQNMVGIWLGSPGDGRHCDWVGSGCPGGRVAG